MQIKPAWKTAGSFRYSQAVLSSWHCSLPLMIAFADSYLILAFQFPLILCIEHAASLSTAQMKWDYRQKEQALGSTHSAYEATAFGN